jgi:uncharacterized repeat protein (TIGR03803 family)
MLPLVRTRGYGVIVRTLSLGRIARIVIVFSAAAVVPLSAQTFNTLFTFDGTNGAIPEFGSLVQGEDGELYGTTESGGVSPNDGGTVFEITSVGALTTLYGFSTRHGAVPNGGLVLATGGSFFGTTTEGGHHGDRTSSEGTVFKVTPGGTLTTLYSFCAQTDCTDGEAPQASLIQASNGNFYGTTQMGGNPNCAISDEGCGTVFEITSQGALTTLYSFCTLTNCTDGAFLLGSVLQATDGNLYGTTESGGANCIPDGGCGTVFKLSLSGTLTTLYSFCAQPSCSDGQHPYAGLIQATNGNLYGTTVGGGANNYGTVFEITTGGTLTTLYSFCTQTNCADGNGPVAGLFQATDGNFYGTTLYGGANCVPKGGCGTVFEITPESTLTTLYSFCAQANCTDGFGPQAAPVEATNGILYGTTPAGGTGECNGGGGCGTIFSIDVGLNPLIEMMPASGKAGAVVEILGTSLTGATTVSFNGTEAAFTVVSNSLIRATVPTGASTGFVTVVTPSATLRSNKRFRVEP